MHPTWSAERASVLASSVLLLANSSGGGAPDRADIITAKRGPRHLHRELDLVAAATTRAASVAPPSGSTRRSPARLRRGRDDAIGGRRDRRFSRLHTLSQSTTDPIPQTRSITA